MLLPVRLEQMKQVMMAGWNAHLRSHHHFVSAHLRTQHLVICQQLPEIDISFSAFSLRYHCTIYFHPVVCSSSFFVSSPNLSRSRLDVYHTSTHGVAFETCCTRLAGNAGCKKSPKSSHLRTIVQLCRAISSQLRHISTIGKKTC